MYCSETAVSRLYANLGLGYDAPNSVDDAEFADNPRQGRPVGHARLQPSAHAAGDNLRQHRHPGGLLWPSSGCCTLYVNMKRKRGAAITPQKHYQWTARSGSSYCKVKMCISVQSHSAHMMQNEMPLLSKWTGVRECVKYFMADRQTVHCSLL